MTTIGELTWKKISKNYGFCQYDACPRHADCLRWVCAALIPEGALQEPFIVPRIVRQATEQGCPAFAPATPVRMALGFRRALGYVLSRDTAAVRGAICGALGVSFGPYYRMREGSYPLTPEMQERVAAILERYGVPAPVEFDAYEERIYFEY
ncbi:MAG: hypothetical protein IJ722_00685 [Alloprevotella sp.]|nr:hypothetical protein [Alloprevotella sp.]